MITSTVYNIAYIILPLPSSHYKTNPTPKPKNIENPTFQYPTTVLLNAAFRELSPPILLSDDVDEVVVVWVVDVPEDWEGEVVDVDDDGDDEEDEEVEFEEFEERFDVPPEPGSPKPIAY